MDLMMAIWLQTKAEKLLEIMFGELLKKILTEEISQLMHFITALSPEELKIIIKD